MGSMQGRHSRNGGLMLPALRHWDSSWMSPLRGRIARRAGGSRSSHRKQLAILYLSFLDAKRSQQPGLQRKPIRASTKPPAPYLHGLVQRGPCACSAILFHFCLLDSVTRYVPRCCCTTSCREASCLCA